MTLDVVICTYKRSALMRKALASLLRANRPEGLTVQIFLIDNNSRDDTADVVREMQSHASVPIHYIVETRQGLSHARNRGIASGTGELIGLIDDDEEIDEHWFEVIAREFQDTAVQYIGGPCLPNWQVPAPDWLPPGYHSVIGAIPPKPRGNYGPGHPGFLNGGNAVMRRSVFQRVGGYSVRLGRTAKGLLSEEDAELFRRILQAGLTGLYVPELVILHFIPADRLTRRYHRRWAFWRAVSQGIVDRDDREEVTYLLGIPRHRIGRAIRSILAWPRHFLHRVTRGAAFADELAVWDLIGFVYGKFLFRLPDTAITEGA